MEFTRMQKKVLRDKGYCKVVYRNMYQNDHELGYCSKGSRYYDINIANDAPNDDVKDITLLHELGHIYYGHVELNQKEEFKRIKEICDKLNRDFYELTAFYKGPHRFLNICMDMEINTSILTPSNIAAMHAIGFELCVPEAYKIELEENFRDYYEPMITLMPDKDEFKKMVKQEIRKKKKEIEQYFGPAGPCAPEDLPSDGNMGLDPDFEDIIRKAIQDEEYISGNNKAQKDNRTTLEGREGTVNDAVDRNEARAEGDDPSQQSTPGSGSGNGSLQISSGDTNKDILKFLEDITEVSMSRHLDPLRHYNRGTRRNDAGILYNSARMRRTQLQKKLGIIIDVSGSMNTTSIIAAIKSTEKSNISKDSTVVTWDTDFVTEFPVDKCPDQVRNGGGTDIGKGVKYLIDKGMKEIVIYSDFETDMDDMFESYNEGEKKGCKFYGILVDNNPKEKEKDLKQNPSSNPVNLFLTKACKKCLVVKA